MRVVEITRVGGPEVLELVDRATPAPASGEVRVRHHAVGLNFIDTYQRTGLYPLTLPAVLGSEMAGVVEAVGDGVTTLQVGDRVACGTATAAYAEASIQPADRMVRLPDGINAETAAGVMLKGLTAWMLACRMRALQAGETVLVHAAAGGVGSLLVQWLTHLDIRVIGTAGSPEKAVMARAHGCEAVILYRTENVAERVRELTDERGVSVVYDSVGADTFEASLASLARRGLLVSYGNASGPVPPFAPLRLARAGSLFLTRPTLFHYVDTPEDLQTGAKALFELIASGAIKPPPGQRRPLSDVRRAHEDLEARRTTGATVLIP